MSWVQNEELTAYVEQHPGIAPAALAERFGVGTRAIRKHISLINAALADCAVIEYERKGSQGAGYYLNVRDANAYRAWYRRTSSARRAALPETAAERTRYLLNDLLLRTDWITRERLAEILYVSPASISASLKEIDRILGSFGLTLERRPRYGVRISGPEMARRLCLASSAVHELDQVESEEDDASDAESAMVRDLRNQLMLDTVSACVTQVLDQSEFPINSFSYQNLLVHIGIALMRIKKGCYIPLTDVQIEERRHTREYEIAQRIADAIDANLQVRLPDEEVAYISIHLAGKRVITGAASAPDGGDSIISDEVWDVVSDILTRIWEAFRFDLRGDLELRMNLAQHIVPLAVRLKYRMAAQNPMAAEIKARYPLAYSMALEASGVLAEHYGAELSDDEVSYLAMSFALSLERQKTERPKKNIMVVCATARGSARLMEYRYRREFGDYIDRIEVCDAQHVATADLSDIDYVFTTVPLAERLPVPVREVGYFLDDQDVTAIRGLFQNEGGTAAAGVLSHLDRRLFFTHLAETTKDAVLERLCRNISAIRTVDDTLLEQVQLREQAAPTAFGGPAALPHPYSPVTDETFLCVGLLDHPIPWDGSEVQAVFLLCVARTREDDLDEFYDRLSDLMFNTEAINRLLEDQRFEVLERVFVPDGNETASA